MPAEACQSTLSREVRYLSTLKEKVSAPSRSLAQGRQDARAPGWTPLAVRPARPARPRELFSRAGGVFEVEREEACKDFLVVEAGGEAVGGSDNLVEARRCLFAHAINTTRG